MDQVAIRQSILSNLFEFEELTDDHWLSLVSITKDVPLEHWYDIAPIMESLVRKGQVLRLYVFTDQFNRDVYWYRLAHTIKS